MEFDSILNLEAEWEAEGRRDGEKQGRAQGLFDGQSLGLQKGRELGHELGFYAGCAECWLKMYRDSQTACNNDGASVQDRAETATPECDSEIPIPREVPKELPQEVRHLLAGADWSAPKCTSRAANNLEHIISLVNTFPVDDLTNEAVSDTIDKIRGKFKTVVSQLGMVRGQVAKEGGLVF